MSARYAIYFAPAQDSVLWRSGCAWLGRDAASGIALSQPPVDSVSGERLRALTASPRHYGLHATLKPPFRLAAGTTDEMLVGAVSELAARMPSFTLPPLQVDLLSGFIALRTQHESDALRRLAETCVVELDGFRRPANADELGARRAHGLTEAQEAMLVRFGYPYVMSEWRFHITLTGRVDGRERDLLLPWLAGHFAPALAAPVPCNDICLFIRARCNTDFTLHSRFALGMR